MASRLNPYLSFDGNARQAMEFYGEVFGAAPTFSTFGEYGDPSQPGADKIMHSQLESPAGFHLMASDTAPGMPYSPGDSFAVCLSGDDEAELRGYWEKLSDGGKESVALEPQMWGDTFGMCTDQFGIGWMVSILGSHPA